MPIDAASVAAGHNKATAGGNWLEKGNADASG